MTNIDRVWIAAGISALGYTMVDNHIATLVSGLVFTGALVVALVYRPVQ